MYRTFDRKEYTNCFSSIDSRLTKHEVFFPRDESSRAYQVFFLKMLTVLSRGCIVKILYFPNKWGVISL